MTRWKNHSKNLKIKIRNVSVNRLHRKKKHCLLIKLKIIMNTIPKSAGSPKWSCFMHRSREVITFFLKKRFFARSFLILFLFLATFDRYVGGLVSFWFSAFKLLQTPWRRNEKSCWLNMKNFAHTPETWRFSHFLFPQGKMSVYAGEE